MSREPEQAGGRLVDLCVGLLLASMALYGAIAILRAIWIFLCILVAVGGLVALVWRLVATRYRGW